MESPGQDAFGVPPKLNRSCELCRVRKIRCSPRASIPGSRCSRCIERNLVCEYKPASKRSRQRIAHRIKELENKLEALIPLVSQVEEDATGVYHGVATDLSKDTFRSSLDPTLSILSSHTGTTSNRPESPVATAPDLNSLSASEEVSLYNYFRDELLPHYPVIHIPMSNNYNTIRDKKPLLYHAMVTASSAAMQPMIAPMLYRSLEQTLAQAAMVDGQKSLDLVQALLISAIWAYPPSSFSELKFGRFAQMAADILMDLNILDELSQCLSQDGYLKIDSLGDEIPWLEKARTLLGCFLLCSSIALAFRRPSILAYTHSIGKCIKFLEVSWYAAPLDRILSSWATLQRQAEDLTSVVTMEDRTQFHLRILSSVAHLSSWAASIKQEQMNACMMIHYHYIRVYAFERILHGEFQPEDFKPPYIIRGIATRLDTGPTVQSADGYNNFFALNDCLLAGRSLLDSFLALSIKDLSTIPVIVYTRMIYVTVILAKLYISIQSLDSRFRDMVESTSLGFDSYISKLVALLRAQELQTMRVPRIFRKILERIATWCIEKLQLQVLGVDTHDSDVLRPMEFNDSPVEVDTRSCITTSSSLSPIRASSFASVGDPYLVEFQSIFPFLDRD